MKTVAAFMVLLGGLRLCLAQHPTSTFSIPTAEIDALQDELREAERGTSSVDVRRACKSIVRTANGLLEMAVDAPNRYELLAIVFESQKRLLSLEVTEQNRAAIFETAHKLSEAPDEYAESRFEADMLLSEKKLAEAEATVADRLDALKEMLAEYRGTPAEWKSLVMGSLIATKLYAFDVDIQIRDTMLERFAGDHRVIDYRRKSQGGGPIEAVFSGTYNSATGTTIVFPHDLMGHQYLLYFWSRETPGIDEHLKAVKAMQMRHHGKLDIYSFNVDKLPDAGAQMLRERGLDWTALHLPEGRDGSTYRAYAEMDPSAVLVNGQGHVLLEPPPMRVRTAADDRPGRLGSWNLTALESRLDDERYLAQLRSLFAGDFLAGASGQATTNQTIQACFRLARKALRDGVTDPEDLLADFIANSGGDNASAAALAAAAILALEANARTAHERYRERLLRLENDDFPELWPVYAFLRDKHHRYRNFWASPGGYGYDRPQKYKFRDTVAGLLQPEDRNRRVSFELRTLEDGMITVPGEPSGEMTGVIFAEPPESIPARSNLMSLVNGFANEYISLDVKVVLAFLSEDTNTVRELVKDLSVACQVGIVPGGLGSPIVRQLGILSSDRVPNLLLLRADGTLAWTISGLGYTHYGSNPQFAMSHAIQTNIEKVRSDEAFEALGRGEFRIALERFDADLPPNGEKDWWTADRLQGRALAYMGLGDWKAALTEIDAAHDQRLADFGSAVCKCHGIVEMCLTKATILDKLNRGHESETERRRAARENLPHSKLPPGMARTGVPVGVYYEQLKRIRKAVEDTAPGKQ